MSEEDKNEHKLKPLDLDFEEILKIVEADFGDYRKAYEIEKYIKRCFRVACEFYLRYKDNPELLMREKSEIYLHLREICPSYEGNGGCKVDHTVCRFPACVWFSWRSVDLRKYNDWLFKLAFKSVLD